MKRIFQGSWIGWVLLAPALAAAGTLDQIRASGELKLAYRSEAPPFSSKAPGASVPEGFSIDLCRIVADDIKVQLGLDELKVTWIKVNAEERIDAIANGRAHMECGVTTVTLSRMERVDFSNLFYVTGASLLVPVDGTVTSVDDLGGRRVSVVRGTTTERVLTETLDARGINARVVRVPNHAQGLQKLVNGEVHAHAGDQATLFGIGFKSQGQQRFMITEDLLSFEPYAFPLPRNDADFRLAVNRSLSNLYKRGDVGRIWERHFGVHGVRPTRLLLTLYRLNTYPE